MGVFHVRFIVLDANFVKLTKFYTQAIFGVLFYEELIAYLSGVLLIRKPPFIRKPPPFGGKNL